MKIKEGLKHLLFPSRCMLCGTVLEGDRQICPACMEKTVLRGGPGRRSPEVHFDGAAAALHYTGAVRKAIHRLKYGEKQSYARPLARLMQEAAERQLRQDFDLITFVPCNPETVRRRGYNQSRLLAEELAARLQRPCVETLRKVRATRPMYGLKPRERRENIRGAYGLCCPETGIAGKVILVADDVLTTGSTLSECAAMLKKHGAAAVFGVCAAAAEENGKNFTNF